MLHCWRDKRRVNHKLSRPLTGGQRALSRTIPDESWREEKKEDIWLSPMTKAPIPTEKSKKQRNNTKTPPKTSITQRLRTDLGPSVGVDVPYCTAGGIREKLPYPILTSSSGDTFPNADLTSEKPGLRRPRRVNIRRGKYERNNMLYFCRNHRGVAIPRHKLAQIKKGHIHVPWGKYERSCMLYFWKFEWSDMLHHRKHHRGSCVF